MSSADASTIRCPRCGNENRSDSFSCSFCGKRLKIEKIENFVLFGKNIFRRVEEEWFTPNAWWLNIYYLFTDPALAFHDINRKRSSAPGYRILLINTLLWGLMGLAFFSHFRIISVNDEAISPFSPLLFWYGLSMFLTFLIFGLIFQIIFYFVLTWIFMKGANYAVGFSERLEARFGGDSDEREKYSEAEMSPFSIYKSGTLMQKQQAYKYKMLFCAFTPFLLINFLKIIIILIAFPTVDIHVTSDEDFDENIFTLMFNSPVWAVLHVIDAITIAIWVPFLMALAIRELSNASTYRVLISSLAIGITVSIFFYFLRPTLFG